VSDFDQGGLVPRRLKASLAGGEFIVVPRHRKLLERINRGR
jgi:hypothetical protein